MTKVDDLLLVKPSSTVDEGETFVLALAIVYSKEVKYLNGVLLQVRCSGNI